MMNFKDLYCVLTAVVPLYITMFLAYASVKWWHIFTPDHCAGINKFVATFAIPLLSFEFISRINPYQMNLRFIAADGISKLLMLAILLCWLKFSKTGSLDRVITIFSLSTLPNTLILGIPLLKSMYGDDKESILIQAVVLQSILWYTLLLFLFEYREAIAVVVNQSIEGHNGSVKREENLRKIQERIGSGEHNEDDIINVIHSTPSNHQTSQNVNRVAPAVSSTVVDEGKEVHVFIWRCKCCTSPGVCEQSMEVCSRGNEKAVNLHQPDIQSSASPDSFVKILKFVCIKLLKNPNSYASLLGLIWALVSCRWGIKKPQLMEKSVTILSDAGLGMAMFSLGLFMASQPKIIACGKRLAAYGMLARFVAGPAMMAIASLGVGLQGTILRVSIVQAALPQGIVPFVFAREYNLHPDMLSTAVIFGMIVSLPITMLYYILLGL